MLMWLLGMDGDWVVTIVQIVLGVVFFAHGAQKALGWLVDRIASTVAYSRALANPGAVPVLAVAASSGRFGPDCWTSKPASRLLATPWS